MSPKRVVVDEVAATCMVNATAKFSKNMSASRAIVLAMILCLTVTTSCYGLKQGLYQSGVNQEFVQVFSFIQSADHQLVVKDVDTILSRARNQKQSSSPLTRSEVAALLKSEAQKDSIFILFGVDDLTAKKSPRAKIQVMKSKFKKMKSFFEELGYKRSLVAFATSTADRRGFYVLEYKGLSGSSSKVLSEAESELNRRRFKEAQRRFKTAQQFYPIPEDVLEPTFIIEGDFGSNQMYFVPGKGLEEKKPKPIVEKKRTLLRKIKASNYSTLDEFLHGSGTSFWGYDAF